MGFLATNINLGWIRYGRNYVEPKDPLSRGLKFCGVVISGLMLFFLAVFALLIIYAIGSILLS